MCVCMCVCGQEMIIIRMTNDQSIMQSVRREEGGSKRESKIIKSISKSRLKSKGIIYYKCLIVFVLVYPLF